jgi:ubiquinone/menaquinone biosynthesis C-methylase UbiE
MAASASSVARQFIESNRRLSKNLERELPQAQIDLQVEYERRVTECMNAAPGLVVLDVGSGKRCHFARHRWPSLRTRIVGLDVSADELSPNVDVDAKVVWSAEQPLPFADESADLIVSRSTLEHFPRVEPFLAEAYRVLTPGGITIHVFPSKWAAFSVINRVLPNAWSRVLIDRLLPVRSREIGFVAHYDHCTARSMERAMSRHGFEVVESHVGYYQAGYFAFFLPAYAVIAGWEMLMWGLGWRPFAANVLIVARKPSRPGNISRSSEV